MTATRRRSHVSGLLSIVVVIRAGFGIAAVEALRLPKASIWIVVVGAIVLISVIRLLTRPPR